jgi:MOSC domain-containing protein YiiM
MKTIRDLNKPPQIEGRVESIIVRGSPRERATTVAGTVALAGIGLADDRLRHLGESELPTRQVTLIQAEHLPVIAGLARVEPIDPIGLRRNLVISGINLLAPGLQGRNRHGASQAWGLMLPSHRASSTCIGSAR